MADLILGSRNSGKTTELIKKSASEGLYILVPTKAQAKCIFDQACLMGYDIPFPVTWAEFQKCHFRDSCIKIDGLLIDEVGLLLSYIFNGIPIKTVTWTKDGVKDLDKFEYSHGGSYELYPRPIDYQHVIDRQSRRIKMLETQLKTIQESNVEVARKELDRAHKKLEKAYHVIGQIVDSPNPFEKG